MPGADLPLAGPRFEVPIERGKIREFAAATQSSAPEYLDGTTSPATFLISSSFWAPPAARPDHGFDRRRLLHGEQEYRFVGPPPRAGQVLVAQTSLVERYEREGKRGGTMRFAVYVTEFRDESGALVAEQHSTFIETAPANRAAS